MSSAYSRYIDCSHPPCTYHYGNGNVPPSLYHWPSHGWDGYYSRPQQHCIPYDHTAYHYYSRPTFHEYYDPPNSQFNYPPVNMPYIHYGYRPLHPAEQFRHPDDYPVHPNYHHYYPSELHYPQRHCCGCPNHVCHSGPLHSEEKNQVAIKNNRPTIVDDEGARDMVKNGSECGKKIQQISPGIWFMPYDGQTPGTESQKKKDESPTYWIPLKDAESSNAKSGVDSIPNISFVPQDIKFNNQGMMPPNPRFQEMDKDKNDSCPKIIFIPSNFVSKDETKRTSQGELEEKEELKDAGGIKSIKEENEKVRMESYGNIRDIPVKVKDAKEERGKEKDGMESIKEENGKVEERSGNIIREIPVKQVEDKKMADCTKSCKLDHSKENGDPKGSKKSSPSSSRRALKLPPVCLRVDPLPSKKRCTNGNGKSSSRSPSPSHKNEVCSVPQINSDGNGEKEELKEMKANPYSCANSELKEVKTNPSIQANSSLKFEESVKGVVDDVTNKKGAEGSDNRGVTKRKFSEEEAATTIKAAYRGYLVRKLHPLKKLREINKVKLRVREIEQTISCPSFKEELVTDSKVKVRTNELIMSLLLQLDTIQGLHPDVREVRKSVARELSRLQESLDMLVEQATANQENQADIKSQIPDASTEETPVTATTFERTDMPTQPVMLLNNATTVEKGSNLENMMPAAEANGAKLNNDTKGVNDMEAEALEGLQSMVAVSEEANAAGYLCNVFIEEEQDNKIVEKGSNLENMMSAAEANGAKLNNETKGGNDMEVEGLEGLQSMLAVSEDTNAADDSCNVFIEDEGAKEVVEKGSNFENMMSAAEVNGTNLNNETKGGNDMEVEGLEGLQRMLVAVSEEINAAGDLCNVFIEDEQAKEKTLWPENGDEEQDVHEDIVSAFEEKQADLKTDEEEKCPVPNDEIEKEPLSIDTIVSWPTESDQDEDSKVQDSSFPKDPEDARTSIEIPEVRMSKPKELRTEGFEEVKTSESEEPAAKSIKAEDTLKGEDSSINIHISQLSGLDSINNDEQNEMSKPQIGDGLVLAQDMEEIPLGFGSEETVIPPQEENAEICKNKRSQILPHEGEEDDVNHLMDPKGMLEDGNPTKEEWEEENQRNSRLKKMVEELLEAGKQQMSTIDQLRDKVRMLENKLNEEKSIIRRKPKIARKKAKHVILKNKTCSPGLGA